MADNRDYDSLMYTHDVPLPDWGPYSKLMAGIAHIFDIDRGAAFNLSVFPCIYRGLLQMPSELYEGSFYPEDADENGYGYRFNLLPGLTAKVSYRPESKTGASVFFEARNETNEAQMLGLHTVMSMQYPMGADGYQTWAKPECGAPFEYVDGVEYESISTGVRTPQEHLVYDGRFFCEERCEQAVYGRCLSGVFAKCAGDSVTYRLNGKGRVFVRLKGHARLKAGKTLIDIDSDAFETREAEAEGETIVITCLEAGKVYIDCVVICDKQPDFVPDIPGIVPALTDENARVTLDYGNGCVYAFSRFAPENTYFLREIRDSDIDGTLRLKANDHVSHVLGGDGKAHYTDLYERPFFLKPGETLALRAYTCKGHEGKPDETALAPAESALPHGIRLMRATLITNAVFPVYVQGKFIRHFTPGKWWDSLYTWDSGFIALGLLTVNSELALRVLNCYLTEPGNPHAAFIHHGSPVPVQAYVYKSLWDRLRDTAFLKSFYPRMKQYYDFLTGKAEGSDTNRLHSGILNTFSYFYNTGGWDDYPPQVYVHKHGLENSVSPCVTTVHAIVFARILRHAAKMLGIGDVSEYDADINAFGNALETYAYDAESGYFSYVCHDKNGNPNGILRHESGQNLNMGLDGLEPLLTGICTREQEDRIVDLLMDDTRLWTDCGLSTVDKSAAYYTDDGYWNGAVWMPHQYFVFLGLLSVNRPDEAFRIASTALDIWEREAKATNKCSEHFIVASGRGGGWHRFSGLSTPVLVWHEAYHVPGTVTAPIEAFVTQAEFGNGFSSARVTVDAEGSREEVTLLIAAGGDSVKVNGAPQPVKRYAGALAIRIPGKGISEIEID